MLNRQAAHLALAGAIILVVALAGCSAEKDEYNPIRILCPGDFDPVTNKCKIDTPSP